MELVKRTARRFAEEVHRFPQNGGLFPDAVIYEVLDADRFSSADKRVAKAELAVRYFLSRNRYSHNVEDGKPDVAALLTDWLGADTLCDFLEKAELCGLTPGNRSRVDRAFAVLTSAAPGLGDADVQAVCRAFRPWLEADGVIPVYNDAGAYLLPFCYSEANKSVSVRDSGGVEIPEWTALLRALAEMMPKECRIDRGVEVSVWQNEHVRPGGNSLMLPLLMAWYRKFVDTSVRLPRYNPLRFVATGAVIGGRLEHVSTEEKLDKISNEVDGGFLVRPGNGRDAGTVAVGESLLNTLDRIRDFAEVDYDTAAVNAAKRIGALERAVRQGCQRGWDEMIRRLERLSENIDRDDQPDEYADALMLRSAAMCHAGYTAEAKALNEKARERLCSCPDSVTRLLRLEIEELVILQDEEDFEKVYALSGSLGDRINSYCSEHAEDNRARRRGLDLQMRYYGTMGQFESYAALAGFPGHSPETALRHFESAWRCAVDLARNGRDEIPEDEYAVMLSDRTQDANYLLLWRALFDEQNMIEAHSEARRCAEKLRGLGQDDAADKNDSFRRRFAALGMYRAVLNGHDVPEVDDDFDSVFGNGPDWLQATLGKYLGAIAARSGDANSAKAYFDLAVSVLEKKIFGIFGEIHMTVFAEAFRSLRNLDPEYAERMRTEALTVLNNEDVTCRWKSVWRQWLEDGGEDSEFPGRTFWY